MHAHGRRRLPVEQESRRSRSKRDPNPQRQPTTVINGNTFVLTRPLTFTITQPVQPTQTNVAQTLGQTLTAIGDPDADSTRPTTSSSSIASLPTTSSSDATTSRVVPTPSIVVNPNAGSEGSPEPVQTSSQNSTLPGGAIAGIVIGVLVILVTIFVVLLRKKLMRNRLKKRDTWAAQKPGVSSSDIIVSSAGPSSVGGVGGVGVGGGGYGYGERVVTGPAMSTTGPLPMMRPGVLVPPPFAYNNSQPPSVTSTLPYSNMGTPTTTTASSMPNAATVRSTFIPTLPDELPIHVGEVVRVVAEYDDGWVLCSNASGEKGMVPLECLEKPVGLGFGGSFGGLSRRASSLAPNRG